MRSTVSLIALATLLAAACGNKSDQGKGPPPTPTTSPPPPVTATPPAPPTPTTPPSTAPSPGTPPSTVTPGTPPSATTTPPGTPVPAANTPHTTDHPSRAHTSVLEGAACSAGLRPVTDVPIQVAGSALSFTRSRGGGCPTRAVYTVFYVKGDPVQVRVCEDPDADLCEMMIVDEKVSIELTPALKASGATTAVLAR